MITASNKLQLKIERPFVVFFYRALARWAGEIHILLLTTTGRTSGRRWTVPVVYMALEDRFIIVAANLGSDKHPGWYLNLQHDPHAEIQIGRAKMSVSAEEPPAEVRNQLWRNWIQTNPGYQGFQAKTTRQLPVVILKRVQPS